MKLDDIVFYTYEKFGNLKRFKELTGISPSVIYNIANKKTKKVDINMAIRLSIALNLDWRDIYDAR